VTYPGAVIAPEARNDAETRIAATQQKLKADKMNWQLWVDLGIYQKQAGDYEGALLSWKYAAYIAPGDYVALADIGNLYAYFIKDNAQAESYYKQAIAKGSTQAYLYVQLGEVYRDIFKDAAKAKAIAEEGLSKIPNDPSLLQFKATLN
jgi:tetratricopeptide (TPR) repeat protein